MTASYKHLEIWKEQLGMDFGKANQQLFKMMVWKMATICGMDKCSHCKQPIEKPNDLSLEHKEPWRGIEGRPARPELFWDLDNIAFSHIWCNAGSPTRGKGARMTCGVDKYTNTNNRGYTKYRARLGMNSKLIDLGYWDSELEAGVAYDYGVMHFRNGCGILNHEVLRQQYKDYLDEHGFPENNGKRGRLKSVVDHFVTIMTDYVAQ